MQTLMTETAYFTRALGTTSHPLTNILIYFARGSSLSEHENADCHVKSKSKMNKSLAYLRKRLKPRVNMSMKMSMDMNTLQEYLGKWFMPKTKILNYFDRELGVTELR